jgi:hypothetical protein
MRRSGTKGLSTVAHPRLAPTVPAPVAAPSGGEIEGPHLVFWVRIREGIGIDPRCDRELRRTHPATSHGPAATPQHHSGYEIEAASGYLVGISAGIWDEL